MIGEQDAVRAVLFVGPGESSGVVEIEAAAWAWGHLAGRVRTGYPQELNGHGKESFVGAQCCFGLQ